MKVRTIIFSFLSLYLVGGIIAAGLIGCDSINKEYESGTLQPIQIQEYQGEKLSSVNDFRENSIAGPQYIDIDEYELSVTGLVDNPGSLTYNEVIDRHQSQQKLITLNCVEGWSATILWEGVSLRDLLQPFGIQPEAKVAIFRAYDGYSSSLPLDYIIEKDIILAYKMNGITMPPERGYPFQLVAEDKWGYKWVKWVTEIELSDDTEFRGFWETRGYSNDGNLEKEFYDFND